MKYCLGLALGLLAMFYSPMSGHAQSSPSRIEIHAKRFSFAPAEITVEKGSAVTLALISEDVPHSLVIDGLQINSKITKGHVTEVTFTPNTEGDFKGRCGRFCGSGHGSMLFMVHVIEK